MLAENGQGLDAFLEKIFHADNVTAQEEQKLQDFFPEGCFFRYEGNEKPPIGSVAVMRGSADIEDACTGCSLDTCEVRKAPYKGISS